MRYMYRCQGALSVFIPFAAQRWLLHHSRMWVAIGIIAVLIVAWVVLGRDDKVKLREVKSLEGGPIGQRQPQSGVSVHRTVDSAAKSPTPTLSAAAATASSPATVYTFDMIYRDADGSASARRIDVASLHENYGSIYIDAWCHLRKGERTFRADRVIELMSVKTGELFAPVGETLFSYIKAENSPGEDWPSVIAKARNGLSALIWIARADNDLSEKECDVLVRFVRARDQMGTGGQRDRHWKDAAVAVWSDGQRPTLDGALTCVAGLGHHGRERLLVERSLVELLAIQDPEIRPKLELRARKLGFQIS